MSLQAAVDTSCNDCHKPILNRRSTLQTKCAPCVYKAANARDKEIRKAQRQATIDARKKDAAETRARRVALKSRRDWMDEAQAAVNKFVRTRDMGKPCVSCNAPWTDTAQAGHYLSRGARPELRYELSNLASQCVRCNMHLSGNLLNYRIGLISRIGVAAVEALEGPHPPARWSVDELKTIRDAYRLLTKQLLEQITSAQTESPAHAPASSEPLLVSSALSGIDAPSHPSSTPELVPLEPASLSPPG